MKTKIRALAEAKRSGQLNVGEQDKLLSQEDGHFSPYKMASKQVTTPEQSFPQNPVGIPPYITSPPTVTPAPAPAPAQPLPVQVPSGQISIILNNQVPPASIPPSPATVASPVAHPAQAQQNLHRASSTNLLPRPSYHSGHTLVRTVPPERLPAVHGPGEARRTIQPRMSSRQLVPLVQGMVRRPTLHQVGPFTYQVPESSATRLQRPPLLTAQPGFRSLT